MQNLFDSATEVALFAQRRTSKTLVDAIKEYPASSGDAQMSFAIDQEVEEAKGRLTSGPKFVHVMREEDSRRWDDFLIIATRTGLPYAISWFRSTLPGLLLPGEEEEGSE